MDQRLSATIAICIPAHDEAAELPGLFAAIEALTVPVGDRVQVCLLLDRSRDASAALAEHYRLASRHAVDVARSDGSDANVGSARRLAMAAGLVVVGDDGVLLSTDADSRPAPDWLVRMRAGLAGADVVAGRIVRAGPRGAHALQDRIEAYYDALFALRRALDPVPWEAPVTHHFTGGANLGFRAAAYRAVGGFLPLAGGEDARLIDDAGRAGLRVRHDASCVVHTSDRLVGRAPFGLAHALTLGAGGEAATVQVAHPDDAAWQFRLHGQVRAAHAMSRWAEVALLLGLTADHVRGVARDCPNDEAFALRIVPTPPGGMRNVPLPVAEAALARLRDARVAA